MNADRKYSDREIESIRVVSDRVSQELDEMDVELAKAAPEVWFTAGLCREYYDALKQSFTEEGDPCSLTEDKIIQLLIGTIGLIKR
jgi:hypothetical protein